MAWRPHSRARVNPSSPKGWAQCDRCNFVYLHADLRPQVIYAGPKLQPINLLVCRECWDIPNPQLKPRILPPDPLPIYNPRPQDAIAMDDDFQTTQDGNILTTESDVPTVGQNVANNREPG